MVDYEPTSRVNGTATHQHPHRHHPDVTHIYDGKFVDRSPQLESAGLLTFMRNEAADDCIRQELKNPTKPIPYPPIKYHGYYSPDVAQRRIHYGKYHDPQPYMDKTHGVSTQQGIDTAKNAVNPAMKTNLQNMMHDLAEGHYESHRQAPLGQSHNQRARLPGTIDPRTSTFGITTERGDGAGVAINPPKSRYMVEYEASQGRDLYRFSHRDFEPGEQTTRTYAEPYNPTNLYGMPTPIFNDGRYARDALNWLQMERAFRHDDVINKRLDDFRQRTQPQLGQPLDPNHDTRGHLPADHAFGIREPSDGVGVGDLLPHRFSRTIFRGRDGLIGLLAAVRGGLKSDNFRKFKELHMAFQDLDPEQRGIISKHDMRVTLDQFNVPLISDMREQLMHYAASTNDSDAVVYDQFMEYIDFRQAKIQETTARRAYPESDIPEDSFHATVDRDLFKKTSDGLARSNCYSTKSYSVRGLPSVRFDRVAPGMQRFGDTINYEADWSARSSMNPSVFTNHGIYKEDMFASRPPHEIRRVFTSAGVEMDDEAFNALWQEASQLHPDGHVCMETFRLVLDQHQTQREMLKGTFC